MPKKAGKRMCMIFEKNMVIVALAHPAQVLRVKAMCINDGGMHDTDKFIFRLKEFSCFEILNLTLQVLTRFS